MAQTPDDGEGRLVELAIRRDHDAFAALYERHASRVYLRLRFMLGDIEEAEDLTVQTFLQAWNAIDRYEIRGAPFVSWLLRIARNLGIGYLRSRREQADLPDHLIDRTSTYDPEEATQRRQDLECVREAMAELTGVQREVLLLRLIGEQDYEHVASYLGMSVPAVRVIMHRALKSLRGQLLGQMPASCQAGLMPS